MWYSKRAPGAARSHALPLHERDRSSVRATLCHWESVQESRGRAKLCGSGLYQTSMMKNARARPCMKGWLGLSCRGLSREELTAEGECEVEHLMGAKVQRLALSSPCWVVQSRVMLFCEMVDRRSWTKQVQGRHTSLTSPSPILSPATLG